MITFNIVVIQPDMSTILIIMVLNCYTNCFLHYYIYFLDHFLVNNSSTSLMISCMYDSSSLLLMEPGPLCFGHRFKIKMIHLASVSLYFSFMYCCPVNPTLYYYYLGYPLPLVMDKGTAWGSASRYACSNDSQEESALPPGNGLPWQPVDWRIHALWRFLLCKCEYTGYMQCAIAPLIHLFSAVKSIHPSIFFRKKMDVVK